MSKAIEFWHGDVVVRADGVKGRVTASFSDGTFRIHWDDQPAGVKDGYYTPAGAEIDLIVNWSAVERKNADQDFPSSAPPRFISPDGKYWLAVDHIVSISQSSDKVGVWVNMSNEGAEWGAQKFEGAAMRRLLFWLDQNTLVLREPPPDYLGGGHASKSET